MQTYEYKVVSAPNRGEKARGIKAPADRFAHALENLMNDLGRDGWEYVRADTLPSEERTGFTKRTTVYHSVLVFRRPVPESATEEPPRKLLTAEAPVGKAPRVKVEPAMPDPEEVTEAPAAQKLEAALAKPQPDEAPEKA
ncbi:hypothetical protein DEA8626_02141 [Defluviimonas aquaemixtae]|uniref:DUF4177 domain-containing protein n=1 Tax=Albidovulum aquaemixtae TaxID=1542388 RepID=A0A2R8B7J2_9RHOB|nr:DUF4177 domain-containing protein [Defluviimonas aquaemixtae]SPH18601.1 hypothetical protein DEA8626_02141 [Defluviimonas aquaemixtae]